MGFPMGFPVDLPVALAVDPLWTVWQTNALESHVPR
jgi:hypothetical protein